jgi:D-sedoheptulose 7-phosphate isomerase
VGVGTGKKIAERHSFGERGRQAYNKPGAHERQENRRGAMRFDSIGARNRKRASLRSFLMLGIKLNPVQFLDRVGDELRKLDTTQIQSLADAIYDRYEKRGTVFVIGNGGSGSSASHFCEDLGKCTLRREDFDNDHKKRLRILSLTDNTPYILAWGNDEGFDRVFVEQLKNLANPCDLLIAISGSGNSPNIIRAVEWANRNGVTTFGCTGFNGGKLINLAHKSFHVALDDMGIVESIHLTAFHWIVDNLHKRIGLEG